MYEIAQELGKIEIFNLSVNSEYSHIHLSQNDQLILVERDKIPALIEALNKLK